MYCLFVSFEYFIIVIVILMGLFFLHTFVIVAEQTREHRKQEDVVAEQNVEVGR